MSSRGKQQGGADERFQRVSRDPRFWEMPERERKIKIDKRFQSMFHDERFKVKYTVDKRGRPVSHTTTDDLKRFYNVEDEEEEEEEGGGEEEEKKKNVMEEEIEEKKRQTLQSRDADEDDNDGETEEEDSVAPGDGEEDVDDDDEEEESGVESEEDSDSGPDLARGKGNVETSSDEDEGDEVDAILRREEEELEHDWGELSKDAQRSDEVSCRLAVCNMDWDRMKARDLFALLGSFTPQGGAVLSVKIYPSEFGKERLKLEETQGPPELKALPDDSEDDTEEERVHREKMRDYQFKRLRYFYAVVECDSDATAAKIYEECDGFEYESSCSVLDLRFVPDDVSFNEEPKDMATDVNLSAYTPKLFTSAANATAKVQLTWDETDHERVTALNRKFNKDELLQMDFNAYLASSSEEEEDEERLPGGSAEAEQGEEEEEEVEEEIEEEEVKKKKMKIKSEEQICKYRDLLRGINEQEKRLQTDRDMEMEITWVPGLKEVTQQLVKKKLEATESSTPWEEFLQKKKQQRKKKKKQDSVEDELSDDQLPPDVDLSDPFFTEELAATDLKKKKKKKQQLEEEEQTAEEEEQLEKQKAEMSLLMEDDDVSDSKHKHFNYDKIVEQQNLSKRKRKRLMKSEEPLDDHFQVDVTDPRFQAMFTSHLFNLDPSHPSYKRTKATQSLQAEKQRRRQDELGAQEATVSRLESATREGVNDCDAATAKKPMDAGLSLLVKSIKSKTLQFQARRKQKN
ncbi:ESF1 homolog [Scophthalmus maximus]|uniref:ESF1 homolog n=1 Tax=Scophthalmus maximus TaxID=52904 RepID=UPI001FA91174|nr:ESF1 homolog [Scophthalmus maximus]XP_047189582.1 ESF1 homolog [Scophthalmus maximus]XP_047189583.1 ESF1 homolog [Scophthalmus maximus]